MDTEQSVRIGPGGRWRVLTAVIAGGVAVLGVLMLVVIALDWPPASGGLVAIRLGVAAVLLAAAAWVRGVMRRNGPHLRLSPAGIEGPGLPAPLPWSGVVETRRHAVRVGRTTQLVVELLQTKEAEEHYLGGLSAPRRALLQADAAAGRPLVGVTITALEREPDAVAELVQSYAERYGLA